MALIGYARVSTDDQSTDPQLDALRAAGCRKVHREHASGADRASPELARALAEVRAGDVLVAVRIDRLARSLAHLLEVIGALDRRGVGFRSLGDPIDTTSPQGRFTLQILGAVAEFVWALIRERTKAGLAAAWGRGRVGGNPGLRTGAADALDRLKRAGEARRDAEALRVADEVLPTLRALRPGLPWSVVARSLDRKGSRRPDGGTWTGPALARVARRLAQDGFLDKGALERAPKGRGSEDLVVLVAMAARTLEKPTLVNIVRHLEGMRVRTPRGGDTSSVSSIQNLLGKAVAQGLLPDRPLPSPESPRRRGRPAKPLTERV